MPNIFNADDGAISGSAGIKLSSDTSGALNIQTNGVTAIAISASQAVSFPATTSLNFTSANITTLTSSSATITNLLATTLTVSSVGIFPAGSASSAAITTAGDTNTGIFFPAADTIAFTEGGVEALRINSSANVGIGTTSPTTKLHVNTGAAGYGITVAANTQTSRTYQIGVDSNSNLAFYESVAAAQRLVLDSSGNLGLGVTPSAWSSGVKALDINNGASFIGTALAASMWSNSIVDTGSTFRYRNNGVAAFYDQAGGVHAWYTATSGTAGNVISFGNAKMTLDASGKLLIGTTTASGSNMIVADAANSGGDVIRAQNTGGTGARISSHANGSTNVGQGPNFYMQNVSGAGTWASSIQMGAQSEILFFQYPNGLWYERARITSDGKFFIGTTTTVASGTEIAGIVGSGRGLSVRSEGGATSFAGSFWNNAASGDNLIIQFYVNAAGDAVGSIDYNRSGGAIRYNTTSDYRAKDVYDHIQNAGETIDALKVYRGKMKGATIERPMMIAHEAQQVVPYAVGGEKDAVNEDGTPKYQTMDHQILVPLLIAEIQSLRQRVAQLEVK